MNKIEYLNGVRYTLVASTKDFRDRESKTLIETMAPIVAEMDANYLKLRVLMDKEVGK
jgi:hypothetical protein